jgi:agmatine deiminase
MNISYDGELYWITAMEHHILTIGLIQLSAVMDPRENLAAAAARVEAAAQKGARIICLPELFRTRYFPRQIGTDASPFLETIPGESTALFTALAKKYEAVIIVPVYYTGSDGNTYNAAVIIDADGSNHPPYHKVHIPQDPGFFEKGYFYPGSDYCTFDTRYGRIAVLICYDQWFPEAARCAALDGAEIIFYPTAIGEPGSSAPEEGSWQDAWELIQRSHAIANSVHVAAVNRVGIEGETRFFGGSFACDAFGKVLARAGDREETLIAEIDLSMNQSVRESWGFIRNRRPDTYNVTCTPFQGGIFPAIRHGDTPRNRGFHMPAEWERHEAVWLAWPHNSETFPRHSEVEDAYVAFIQAIHTSERVDLLVPGPVIHRKVRFRLKEAGVDLAKVVLHTMDYRDVWIRDYGPTFVVNRAMHRTAMVKWEFNAWGGKYEDLAADIKIPLQMNRRLEMPVFSPGIILEGGSIDANGRGTILTSRQCLLNPNRNPTLSPEEIEELLKEYLGAVAVIWLNDGIVGDDTDGHIDDIARFVSPSTIVCAYEEDPADPNHAPLRENYEILRDALDQDGNPFTVVKLPMPAPVIVGDQRYPASYTNFYIGNTTVVVPLFSDPRDQEALGILTKLFEGRTVTGVDARAMVEGFGTFHCATQQHPGV